MHDAQECAAPLKLTLSLWTTSQRTCPPTLPERTNASVAESIGPEPPSTVPEGVAGDGSGPREDARARAGERGVPPVGL